jgi:hypothetical protein
MIYLKDRVWIDHSAIDIWLMHLWDSLPNPHARYIPSTFITPVEVGDGELNPSELNKEIDSFRELFEDLPLHGAACPLETLIYVLNCGPKPNASGNHFCVIVFAPTQQAIYLLGRKITRANTNNNSEDWDSWQGRRIWSRVCILMGWADLPPMTLRTTDWRQNGYDCGPIACHVVQHILTVGLQTQVTGQWKAPSMMACYHMLRWRMAEQVHQAVINGYNRYGSIRTSHAAQLKDIYNPGDLQGLDDYQAGLRQQLLKSPLANLQAVQKDLQQAMRKCRACHRILEDDRHAQASKDHPIPLRRETMKETEQRRHEEALKGTWSSLNQVTGTSNMDKAEESSHEEYDHLRGQDFDGLEENVPKGPLTSTVRKARSMDPRQARMGRFPRPIKPPDLPPPPHQLGLQLKFETRFDVYEGGPPLEDLTPIYDTTHLQLRPSFMYICKQIMLTPAPFSLFKDYGYRLLPWFAQAFYLKEPILVKEHLCPVGLTDPPDSITKYTSNTSKGRHGQNIRVTDQLVVGAEELLDIADEEGDDAILLTGRTLQGQYICMDLLRDAVKPDELAFSCDIDSIIWTTQEPQFNGSIDVYSMPVIRDRAPIWKSNHVQVELLYPQSEDDIASIGGRSEWLSNIHSLSCLPHLSFGALQGSSVAEILLFFPRMMHRDPHRHFWATRIPKEIQDFFWDHVLLPALSSIIPSTRAAYLPVDRSHSAFKLGSGKHSAKFSLAPDDLVKMIRRMKAIVSQLFHHSR